MRTAAIISGFALALPAFAAPAPAPTGSKHNPLLTSNNNLTYKVLKGKDLSTDVIRITDTEVGIQGCLTACDGTIGCDAVTYVATNDEKTTGTCYSRTKGKPHRAGKDTSVAILVAGGATTTITTWPTSPATSTASPSGTAISSSSSAAAPAATPKVFSGLALRSASPIHFDSVNANGTNFWLGAGTSTYCPSEVVNPCPVQNYTVFVGGNNTLSLNTVVPGGQQVYVDSAGALRFTVAHSGNTGVGSSTQGFSIVDENLKFNGTDWLACPFEEFSYVVFSANTVQNRTDCLGFSFRTSELVNATAAWQYI